MAATVDVTGEGVSARGPKRLSACDGSDVALSGVATDYKPLITTIAEVSPPGFRLVTENLFQLDAFRYVDEISAPRGRASPQKVITPWCAACGPLWGHVSARGAISPSGRRPILAGTRREGETTVRDSITWPRLRRLRPVDFATRGHRRPSEKNPRGTGAGS